MRRCEECGVDMIDNMYLMGGFHGERIKLGKTLPKKIDVKAAVCPVCGKVELYTDDLKVVKGLKR